MSIRARMTLGTVALLAAALAAFGVLTYSLLQRSLIGRIDDQLVAAHGPAISALHNTEPTAGGVASSTALLPVGTVVQLLGPDGTVRAVRSFGVPTPPSLRYPTPVPGTRIFDAAAEGDGSPDYRVLATALPDGGGTTLVAIPRTEADTILQRLLILEVLVGFAAILTAGLCTRWSIAFGLRPVTTMAAAADRIAGGNLTDRVQPSDPRSELGRLGLALNSMLERIDASFARQKATEDRLRRFVSDASHELRSPITTIRGYAELFGRGASMRLDHLAHSMDRIEAEAARMGGLVDELLLLARLDEGVPLQRGPVDLASIAGDAIRDLKAGGRDNPVSLAVGESVVLDGDEAKLRQVVANLLANAVTHTPEGTAVHVSVSRADGDVVLCVADEGPGLTPEAAERAFDRFYRAARARSETKGAGLGLSIVSAIVDAHGGRVELEPAGPGARFVCRIPAGE